MNQKNHQKSLQRLVTYHLGDTIKHERVYMDVLTALDNPETGVEEAFRIMLIYLKEN